jgi:hypothetical protein
LEGGRLAFVLPAVILAKDTDQAIRSFLLKNYKIEGIVVRSDGLNFSDNTTFQEILLLCEKEKPTHDSLTTYIMLKNVNSMSYSIVEDILKKRHANEETDNPNYRAITFRQSELDRSNLFIPISLEDYSLMTTWKQIERSDLMETTEQLGLRLDEGLRSRKGGKYPECGLSANDTEDLTKRDYWIITSVAKDSIDIKHRFADLAFTIPSRCTVFGLRNSQSRTSFDVSNVQDRILIETFKGFNNIAAYCELSDQNITTEWKKWVEGRSVNLAVIETLHIEAPNTYFFAYYSEKPRSFSSKFWNVQTKSIDEAKLMTLWFNSSFNFIQLLINRVPTGWFKIRGYVFKDIKAPSIDKLSKDTKEQANQVFEGIRYQQFPAIWVQLARNVTKESIYPTDLTLMKNSFDNFEGNLGKGFVPRRKIDRLFLEILGLKVRIPERFLSDLYLRLLKEICLVKRSAIET